jgi:hypothetical protein
VLKRPVLIGVCGILLGLSWGATASDQEVGNDPWEFKLTPSYYVTTNSTDAYDVNLRANRGAHALWVGYYRRGGEFEQTRTGYEYTLALPFGQLVPSLQLASRGFVGGSINAQIGGPNYVLAGYGRTNTQDYYNLNFDPNDSFVYGVGTSLLPQSNLSLFTVKDNRLHTDQIVTHILWKFAESGNRRWTVDLSNKHGRPTPEDDPVSGNALSVTYDFHDMFVRLARDRKVNFTREDMTRWSLGLRF